METNRVVNANTIAKLVINDKSLYLIANWTDFDTEKFHIKLYYANSCWMGSFSTASAKQYSEKVHETIEEYNKNVRRSLAGEDENFTYDLAIAEDDNSAVFCWKKKYEDAKLVHGTVSVHREDATMDTLIELLIMENKNLKETVMKYSKQINELKNNVDDFKNKLEEAVNSKNSLEESLLGKFVQLLNAKKKRIQILEETLIKLDRPT